MRYDIESWLLEYGLGKGHQAGVWNFLREIPRSFCTSCNDHLVSSTTAILDMRSDNTSVRSLPFVAGGWWRVAGAFDMCSSPAAWAVFGGQIWGRMSFQCECGLMHVILPGVSAPSLHFTLAIIGPNLAFDNTGNLLRCRGLT
jgi:hypothetical protein